MEMLIDDIYELIKDYRADENDAQVIISKNRIFNWVNQFAENDRLLLLTELKNIFDKRYLTKEGIRKVIKDMVPGLAKKYEYKQPNDFLKNAVFLDLQLPGKSQKVMLLFLKEILATEFDFDYKDCGSIQRKYHIYLDDILCTGKTLFYNIKEWASTSYSNNKSNLQALKEGSIELICVYIFIHLSNYQKVLDRFEREIDVSLKENLSIVKAVKVDSKNNLELILPLEANQPDFVIDYKNKIIREVDAYTNNKGFKIKPEEFYRPAGMPKQETFFSSEENRIRFENLILKKGIQIINNANSNKDNMRALGFSLPSHKNFGFGTLCFTWRNVPNNVPLTFWYNGGGNYPLFVVNRSY